MRSFETGAARGAPTDNKHAAYSVVRVEQNFVFLTLLYSKTEKTRRNAKRAASVRRAAFCGNPRHRIHGRDSLPPYSLRQGCNRYSGRNSAVPPAQCPSRCAQVVARKANDQHALAVLQRVGGHGRERFGVDQANKVGRRGKNFAVHRRTQVLTLEIDFRMAALSSPMPSSTTLPKLKPPRVSRSTSAILPLNRRKPPV